MSQHDAMSSDQLSSDQLNSHHLASNSLNQSQLQTQTQLDQQIEQNIDENQHNKEINLKNQVNILLNNADTIDLSTSSQKLDELFNRKRKTEKERQNTFKKKFESIKILTLVLSMNETLKNAQRILFEDLKVAKTEHVVIQHLINQIERARINLDLTDDVSTAIDQMQTKKNFEFASIDLIKKSNTTTKLYNETMSENFQHLKKTIERKMTKLIIVSGFYLLITFIKIRD